MHPEKRYKLREYLPITVFLIIIVIAGVMTGALAVKTLDFGIKNDLFNYFDGFLKNIEEINNVETNVIIYNMRWKSIQIGLNFLAGITAILLPLIPLLIFLQSFVTGFCVAFLFMQHGLTGILLASVTIFINNLIFIPLSIVLGILSLKFAAQALPLYVKKKALPIYSYVDLALFHLLGLLIIFVSALLEAYVYPVLIRIFPF